MKSPPTKTNVIEYGLITWEKWLTIRLCDECLETFLANMHPSYGYNKLREYDYDTCQKCERDTEKRHYYTKNLKPLSKRS